MILFAGALPGRHFVPALCYPGQRILLGESPWQQQGPSVRVGTMCRHFVSLYKEASVPTCNQNLRQIDNITN
jgi:hypothetical protein